jgi:hypothetical protein
MKFGIFANINGDYERLVSTIDKMNRHAVSHVVCLDNLISPLTTIKDLRTTQSDSPCVLDYGSLRCIDFIERYKRARNPDGKKVFEFIDFFKGQNELDFLLHEHELGRLNTQEYHLVSDRISYVIDSLVPGIKFALTNGNVKDDDRPKDPGEKARYILRHLESLVSGEKVNICFNGDNEEQLAYEVIEGDITQLHSREIIIGPGRSYVVFPSSKNGGYAIYDVDKDGKSIKLF